MDRRDLPVHHDAGSHDTRSEDLADRLMSKTDAEDRHVARDLLDKLQRDPRFVRRAWPRRDHDMCRTHRTYLFDADGIVAHHMQFLAEFPQILHEVVGEGIVVVDDEKHGRNYEFI